VVPLSSIRVAAVCLVSCNRKAVDVAVREGAGDEDLTITKALQLLRDNKLDLSRQTLVIVDAAAMVGTNDLRQLLSATTTAGTKTVLVGDEHQLAPVKARGGMFAQLCADLPWAQHLSEVSRMRDPEERSASLALRDGGPASMRRAIGWYRSRSPVLRGCDHHGRRRPRGPPDRHRRRQGALLVCDATDTAAVFSNEYLREHITYGYAVTVHSAQGVTADTTHAVLSDAATRALFYVAISRGRDANTAYLYERPVEVSMTASTSTACKALSAEPAGTPVASLGRSSPMTAAGQLPPTVLQPRPRVWACPTASQRCSAAEPPQSFVGERSTQSGRQNRELSSMPWFRPALGTPAGHENTVSTTGSTF
jgi:hypothetical protein